MRMKKNGSDYDVTVIGAGIGGLFAAAKLAKEGKKVLVVEQHSVPGGYATQFKRKQFVFEAGLHAIDGIYNPNNPNLAMFHDLDIFNNLSFIRLPEFYHVSRGDFSFTLADNMDIAHDTLSRKFPHEKKAIKHYLKILKKMRKEILNFPAKRHTLLLLLPLLPIIYPAIMKNIFSSLGSFMNRLTKNEDLKLVLCANTAYYHTDPQQYSLLHYGGAQSIYLSGGCAYIQGGSYKLAEYLSNYIKGNNGTILLNHKVDRINFSGNRISGITFHFHNGHAGKPQSVSTNCIIANANMPSVINTLLPNDQSKHLRKKYNRYKLSHSAFCLYLGLNKPLSAIGNNYYCSFLLPRELKHLKKMRFHNMSNDFSDKIIALVDYSLIDANLSRSNHPTATAMVVDNIRNWEHLSPDAYREKKERMCQVLLETLEQHLPGIRNAVTCYETGTPQTFARYTSNPGGCIYGYAQSVNQVGPRRPNIYSSIPGLYFASAWTKPGGGISPVAKSGYTAACEILKQYT